MTGYEWWTGMIIISQPHKLRPLNTLKILMMMLSSSIRELFLITWQKKAVSWIKQSWHLLLQHYLLNVLKLSHDLMLKKPCNYGCSTWNRSEKLSQGQCWLKSMLGLKMHSMCLSKRGYRVKVGFKNSCERECGMLQRMRVTRDFNQI